ncbi:Argininosuccinate lyase (plasmid) [Variovorax sp. SRS16]|uniref:Bug family tripartite tricarboxylate transporter substrate binding protein n=1 Tax=Variovorax sp. SRS16 TaxID=282217 RepID=UPI00131960EB|nr:tripartite tricarboxylate transporter substrate binding protein [Variovorax sp. SRS16]VTU45401.1 Argininosuccinate lyase [Variovorax sp. SRS16]
MNHLRRSILLGLASVPTLACYAQAQKYPNRPVRLIVPYGAGGSGDAAARSVGEGLGKLWGQTLIIDNRPGANEIVAADLTAKSPPDGYTYLLASEATPSVNPFLYSKLPYDPKDLVPVGRMLTSQYALVVSPDFPAKTLKEFVEEVKRHPGKYNFGSQGIGGPNHLAMSWFENMTGMKMEHVPYRSLPQGIQEVAAGRVEAMFGPIGSISPFIRKGQLKAIAVSGKVRQPEIPDVPTFAESGFPDFEASFYLGVFAPVGTPSDMIHQFSRDMNKVISDSAFQRKYFQPQAYDAIGDTPEQFAEFLKKDRIRAQERVKVSGAKLD